MAALSKERRDYEDFIEHGRRSLGQNEYWCILHPEGPLEETCSKDLAWPVHMICEALNADWDELTDQGYQLGKIVRPS